jgi:hypothetical protein
LNPPSESADAMSYYKDIYNDYPLRCGKLWSRMRRHAEQEKLDVTFMLMAASGGLVAPWEHLKTNDLGSSQEDRHPSFTPGNDEHYTAVLSNVQKQLQAKLGSSSFFKHLNLGRWRLRILENRSQIIGFLETPDDSIGIPLEFTSAGPLISVFRNALAHNNFHAFNRTRAPEIDEIAFFSEHRGETNPTTGRKPLIGYKVISMPHTDFAAFLDAWFKLLESIRADKEHLRKVLIHVFQMETDEKEDHGL